MTSKNITIKRIREMAKTTLYKTIKIELVRKRVSLLCVYLNVQMNDFAYIIYRIHGCHLGIKINDSEQD